MAVPLHADSQTLAPDGIGQPALLRSPCQRHDPNLSSCVYTAERSPVQAPAALFQLLCFNINRGPTQELKCGGLSVTSQFDPPARAGGPLKNTLLLSLSLRKLKKETRIQITAFSSYNLQLERKEADYLPTDLKVSHGENQTKSGNLQF